MRNTSQRVFLVKQRARITKRCLEKQAIERLSLVCMALCCCLVSVASMLSKGGKGVVQGMSGSTMMLENAGGYVLVGVLCFIVAVVITVLCLREKGKNKKSDTIFKEEDEK